MLVEETYRILRHPTHTYKIVGHVIAADFSDTDQVERIYSGQK